MEELVYNCCTVCTELIHARAPGAPLSNAHGPGSADSQCENPNSRMIIPATDVGHIRLTLFIINQSNMITDLLVAGAVVVIDSVLVIAALLYLGHRPRRTLERSSMEFS